MLTADQHWASLGADLFISADGKICLYSSILITYKAAAYNCLG